MVPQKNLVDNLKYNDNRYLLKDFAEEQVISSPIKFTGTVNLIDGNFYLKTEYIVTSSGVADKDKPVKTGPDGYLSPSLLQYSGATWKMISPDGTKDPVIYTDNNGDVVSIGNYTLAGDLRVDGSQIGTSNDIDLITLANNLLTVTGRITTEGTSASLVIDATEANNPYLVFEHDNVEKARIYTDETDSFKLIIDDHNNIKMNQSLDIVGNTTIYQNLEIDGGNIGTSSDPDLIKIDTEEVTINGDLNVEGDLNLFHTKDLPEVPKRKVELVWDETQETLYFGSTGVGHFMELIPGGAVVGATGIQGIQGTTGIQGPLGIQGLRGRTGIQGPEGIQGIRGHTGIQGPIGVTGAGIQGTTGIQGVTGPYGGPKGDTGLQGDTGIAGPPGPPGPYGGPIGYTGLRGHTGIQGPQGIQGPIGYTGVGVQGPTGPAGAPQGVTGLRGLKGNTGNTGAQGDQGATGIRGITGLQGITGISGVTGPAGAPQGITGLQGVTGIGSGPGGKTTYLVTNSDIQVGEVTDDGTLDLLRLKTSNIIGDYGVKINDTDNELGIGLVTPINNSKYIFLQNKKANNYVSSLLLDDREIELFFSKKDPLHPEDPGASNVTSIRINEKDITIEPKHNPYTSARGKVFINAGSVEIGGDLKANSLHLTGADLKITGGIPGSIHYWRPSDGTLNHFFEGIVCANGFTGPGMGGTQGETGLQGPTGIQGITGLSIQGVTGLQGIQGDQGVTGPFGGPQGIQGATGIQGNTGIGLRGYQGDTGVQGIQGEQGVTGPLGGPIGETGLQGIQGIQGVTGAGVQGDTGVQGIQGATGPSVDLDAWIDYSNTSIVTGWEDFNSDSDSCTIKYKQIGKTFYVYFNIVGNSNATYARFTLPKLPVEGFNILSRNVMIMDKFSYLYYPGTIRYNSTMSYVEVSKDISNPFTDYSFKGINGQFFFEVE